MNSKTITTELNATRTRLAEVQAQATTAETDLAKARKAFARKKTTDIALFSAQEKSSALAGVCADLESEIAEGEEALATALASENRARIEAELAELSSAATTNHAEMRGAWGKAVSDLTQSIEAINRHSARLQVARCQFANLANVLGEPHRMNEFNRATNAPLDCSDSLMFRYVADALAHAMDLDSRNLAEIAAS